MVRPYSRRALGRNALKRKPKLDLSPAKSNCNEPSPSCSAGARNPIAWLYGAARGLGAIQTEEWVGQQRSEAAQSWRHRTYKGAKEYLRSSYSDYVEQVDFIGLIHIIIHLIIFFLVLFFISISLLSRSPLDTCDALPVCCVVFLPTRGVI